MEKCKIKIKAKKIPQETLEQSIFRKNLEKRIKDVSEDKDYIDSLPCSCCNRELVPVFVIDNDIIKTSCLMCGNF